jgi:hypothetical protein
VSNPLLVAALSAHRAGLSVHPCQEDGSKMPSPIYRNGLDESGSQKWTWLHPPDARAGPDQLGEWYGNRLGFGVRCGSESGGLECFEFDDRETYDQFKEAAIEAGLADDVDSIEAGYMDESPGGGVHWFYFTDEVRGSTKLAKRPDPKPDNPRNQKTLIETKGENGYIICAPTPGAVHPSGNPYVLRSGGFESVSRIDGPTRDALWDLARSFDQNTKPVAETKVIGRGPGEGGLRPGDDFEQQSTWHEILVGAKWTPVYTRGSATAWRRPGKKIGISATTNYRDSGLLYVFSSSTEFDSEKSYTKFGAYAVLNHGGDFGTAAKSLRTQGYGSVAIARGCSRQVQLRATGTSSELHVESSGNSQEEHVPEADDVLDLWPEIDPRAFHGIVGEIVEAADPHTEADKVAVLVQLLTGFANALGRHPHWVAGATRHYLVLYVALVGQTSSGRKGSAWDVAHHFLKSIDEDWATKRIKGGVTTGEGLIFHVRDKVVKVDKDQKEVVDDPGEPDKRLLCIESELARTLKAMNRESNTLSSVMRSGWDCPETLSTLAKTSTNVATGAIFSFIGHITAHELKGLLTATESSNGLANRFVWVCTRKSKNDPTGGKFFEQDWSGLTNGFHKAYQNALSIKRMTRDTEAEAIWREVYDGLTESKPGMLGLMVGRAEAQVMRIACIYAAIDGSSIVHPEHLEAALALWDYAENSARFVFGESLGDPKAEKLLKTLKVTPDGLTRPQPSVICSPSRQESRR